MNKVMLLGRLTKDPELRYTQGGTAVANFTLAVNRKFANQSGEREADFINCQAWQKTAEFVANYFKKGQQMALEGRLQVRSYDDNGTRKWVTTVIADAVEFCGSKNDGNNSSNNTGGGYGSANTGSSSGYSDPQLGFGEEVLFDDNDLPF